MRSKERLPMTEIMRGAICPRQAAVQSHRLAQAYHVRGGLEACDAVKCFATTAQIYGGQRPRCDTMKVSRRIARTPCRRVRCGELWCDSLVSDEGLESSNANPFHWTLNPIILAQKSKAPNAPCLRRGPMLSPHRRFPTVFDVEDDKDHPMIIAGCI